MKGKSFLTVEDLVNFFDSHKIYNFSSKETGKKIVVKSVQDFSSKFEVDEESNKLFAKVRVCHTLLNRNGSYIPEEAMTNAMPSLKYDPLLASIHQLDDGSWDFHSHDFHVVENEDGDEEIVYDEHQVGTFTNDDPYLEYDNVMDKTYVVAKVAIPVEYTKTADIIQEKGETKVSCEISVNSCSYDAKNKYLVIDDFEFLGCTLLGSEKDGTPIGEGMLGSKLTLEDFSEDNNSMFAMFKNQLSEFQDRLSKVESACSNISFSKEGGSQGVMTKFEELLAKYNKTAEDINFEYENMSEEELESKFAELFDDGDPDPEPEGDEPEDNGADDGTDDGTDDGDDDKDDGDDPEPDPESEPEPEPVVDDGSDDDQIVDYPKAEKKNFEVTIQQNEKQFAVSLQEKIYALSDLVNITYAEADNTYYFVTVFEGYLVMQDACTGKFFKQEYVDTDGTFALSGERYLVYAEFVTEEEQKSLNEMRSNYEELVEFKEEFEKSKFELKEKENNVKVFANIKKSGGRYGNLFKR